MTDKWEYEVLRMLNVNQKVEEILPAYGEKGWELTGILPQPPHTYLIFKRRKS